MARGGKRKPANPKPVSGPGALSERTDGQPVRAAVGGTPGAPNPNLPALQEAAPLAAGGATPSDRPPSAPPAVNPVLDVFRPTERPQESALSGITPEPNPLERDPDALLRVLYAKYPHPDIARLINPYAGP